MKKYIEILKKCPLFYGIEEENLMSMLGCISASVKKYDKKETIFEEGTPGKYIGIVLEGKVQIERSDIDGNRSIVGIAHKSEMFGETFACASIDALPVNVIAAEKSTVLVADCARIISSCCNVCPFHEKMIYNLLKNVAEKNIRFNKKLEILSCRTTKEKLMAYLKSVAKEKGSRHFDIPFDRQELADYLGVNRSGLSIEISRLKSEGLIECSKNSFTLCCV